MSRSKKKPKRPNERQSEHLKQRKVCLISPEGEKTEPEYFRMFNSRAFTVKVLKPSGSSPNKVLDKMKEHVAKYTLQEDDIAWVVTDKDNWTDEQLEPLHIWAKQSEKYGFALSNPCFELWLLLHFEDGKEATTKDKCKEKLIKCDTGYDKGIKTNLYKDNVLNAVERARIKDNPPCLDWPRQGGVTTVYRLVEKLIGDEEAR